MLLDLAEVALLPQIVGREHIVTATAHNEIGRKLAFLLGPALGGVIYSLGKFLPFLLDACSYFLSVLSLSWMRTRVQRVSRPEKLWPDIRTGLLWIWGQPLILFIALLGILHHLLFDGLVLLVIVPGQHMHATPSAIGLVLAMDGVGSMISSLLADRCLRTLSFYAFFGSCHWL